MPFAFWSSLVTEDEKSRMASRMLAVRPSFGGPPPPVPLGRPPFPDIIEGGSLADYIEPESWLLFDLLEADVDWLTQPPTAWDGNPGFDAIRDVVHNICGVNDPAERLCGLAKKYAVSTS